MGVKYLTSYIASNPHLKHSVTFHDDSKHDADTEKKLIVWDCLAWSHRLCAAHKRESKLFSDFHQMNVECKLVIDAFQSAGFELIAFIDGYHCNVKASEMKRRKKEKLKKTRKNMKLIQQMYANTDQQQQQEHKWWINKLEFVPSSGHSQILEQALTNHGCKVYRGLGDNDIDKDVAQFVVQHKDKVYGILSRDTDYFAFDALPKELKLIHQFEIEQATSNKEQTNDVELTLTLQFFYAHQIWDAMGLTANQQRLQFVCFCGNDFIKKRDKHKILKRCHLQRNENDDQKLQQNEKAFVEYVAKAIVHKAVRPPINVDEKVRAFYTVDKQQKRPFYDNVNAKYMDLLHNQVFEGSLFCHDVDAAQFSIHQKLTGIRHAVIRQRVKIEAFTEYIATYSHSDGVHVYEQREVNLKEMKLDDADLQIAERNEPHLYAMARQALDILMARKWITLIQYRALWLQLELKFSLRQSYKVWPFYEAYCRFKADGIPNTPDYTAQYLYLELLRWLSLRPHNVLPAVTVYFDGPLFHYLCSVQYEGDKQGTVKQMLLKMEQCNDET